MRRLVVDSTGSLTVYPCEAQMYQQFMLKLDSQMHIGELPGGQMGGTWMHLPLWGTGGGNGDGNADDEDGTKRKTTANRTMVFMVVPFISLLLAYP